MSVVLSLGVLAAGLLPLAVLRSRSDDPAAPRRPVTRDALVALGRLHRERPVPVVAERTTPVFPQGVASLDAYRQRRARRAHPAGRGRVARSQGA
jgi:hypothetical protein